MRQTQLISKRRIDLLEIGRQVLALESAALREIGQRLDERFAECVKLLDACRGQVVVTGMGKAGLVAQKVSATLTSTGTRSIFLHPGEALHGDLGRLHADDVLLVLSQSGETEEIVRLLAAISELKPTLIAVTARPESTLGRVADVVLPLGQLEEACPLGVAPTTSTTAMMALGDALAAAVLAQRGFTRDDFARLHPAGNLGHKLSRVEDRMRPLAECRVAPDTATLRSVFVEHRRAGRRTGAIMLLDAAGRLSGIFTDSDLARLFETRRDERFDEPITAVMTSAPRTVPAGTRLPEAIELMAQWKISELPVVDRTGKPLGLLDVTDLVGMIPSEPAAVGPAAQIFPVREARRTVAARGGKQTKSKLRAAQPTEPGTRRRA